MNSLQIILNLVNSNAAPIVQLVNELDQTLKAKLELTEAQQVIWSVDDTKFNSSFHGYQASLEVAIVEQILVYGSPLIPSLGNSGEMSYALRTIASAGTDIFTDDDGVWVRSGGNKGTEAACSDLMERLLHTMRK